MCDGSGWGVGRVGRWVERGVEQAVLDAREVLEFPDDQGEFLDQGHLRGGRGMVFVLEFLEEGGEGEVGGGVGDGDLRG